MNDLIPKDFVGFEKEAFELLEKYKENPSVEYNKDVFNKLIRNPFKSIQSGLFQSINDGLEKYKLTDKNARSAHANRSNQLFHHFWAAIYRKDRTHKSNDLQHFWYISNEGFKFGLYTGYHIDFADKLMEHIIKNKELIFKLTEINVNGKKLKTVINDTHGFLITEIQSPEDFEANKKIFLEQGIDFSFHYSVEEAVNRKENIYHDMIEGFAKLKELYKFLISIDYQESNVSHEKKDLNKNNIKALSLPKPFLLLAGISGTGKTRFVRKQADSSASSFGMKINENFCLVSVRPDWHEPSDLLGYISRISGTKYIATVFLKFTVRALVHAVEKIDNGELKWKNHADTAPFWLCLDEMNLAPVEQYFADYLSILETVERNADDAVYKSEPIMKADILRQLAHSNISDKLNSLDNLWGELFADVSCSFKDELCEYFQLHGIPLPPNLIVAGTVNMDETTHGFSRKVIDRALTIDFQEFFPNDYDVFFDGQKEPEILTFPFYSHPAKENLPECDSEGEKSKSVEFLKTVNEILKNTPFELAYRALNELLLSVVSFSPESDIELQSVWDDFLMQKVLPRIEGDQQKLKYNGEHTVNDEKNDKAPDSKLYGKGTILHELYFKLENELLKDIWDGEQRKDFLRANAGNIECRSKKKILWMMKRLKTGHFTDFWV